MGRAIFFKNNDLARKWTEKEAEDSLMSALLWLEANPNKLHRTDVDLFLLKEYGISQSTYYHWVNKQYINNKCIKNIADAIDAILENRVVYDEQKQLRPVVQNLILQAKHDYRQKVDKEESGSLTINYGHRKKSDE